MNTSRIPFAAKRLLPVSALEKLALACALVASASSVRAVPQNWTGPSPGTTASPQSGIWDTTSLNWNSTVGTGNAAFTNATDGAVFAGADGTYFITCNTALTTSNILFSSSGYTLTNDAATAITASTAVGAVTVASGKTATIGTNVAIRTTGNPAIYNNGASAAGTLIIENGGTYAQPNNQPLNIDGGAGSTIRVMPGGTLQHGGNGSNIRIGLTANSSPTISVEGGSFICTGGSSFGSIIVAASGSSTGTVTIVSGMVSNSFTGSAANGSINLGNGAGALGTVNLNGGTLAVANVRKTGASATGILNLNGGTLKAAVGTSGATFMINANATIVNVRNGGATIDNNGFDITIGLPLTHSAIGGDNPVDGGITSIGSGSLALTATNTFTGQTTVTGGTLSLVSSGVINSSSAINIGSSGTLILGNQLVVNASGAFSMTNGTLQVNIINFPTNVVTGTLATGGTTNLVSITTIAGAGSIPQATPLIKYTMLAAGVVDGNNNLTTLGVNLPSTGGFAGYLTNNTAKKTIDLVLTGGSLKPQPIQQPVSITRYKGFTAQFSAVALGASTYQWRSNFVNLSDVGNISGSASSVLTITNVSLSQALNYDVVISNASGSTTSSVASLTVLDTLGYGGTNALLKPVVYYRLNETGDPINTPNLPASDVCGGIDGVYGTATLNSFYGIAGPRPSDGFPGLESDNAAAQFTYNQQSYPSWVAISNSWNLNTNTVTLIAWVYPLGDQASFAGLVYQRAGSVSGLSYTDKTNPLGNRTLGYNWNNDVNAWGWDSGLVPPFNQWSMVALVVTPTNATIYLGNTNGLAYSVHTLAHAAAVFNGPIFIGDDIFAANGSRTFNGNIDEVTAFSRALSQSEITQLLTAASGITNFPPIITVPPSSLTTYQYQNPQLAVQVFGTAPLSYQWQRGSGGTYTNISNGPTGAGSGFSGTTAATLMISNVALSDAADYLIIVTNTVGMTTSSVATLTVNAVLGPGTNITTSTVQGAGLDWDTSSTWNINGTAQNDGATLLAQEYNSGPGQGSVFIIQAPGGLRTPNFNNPNSPTTATFPGDVLRVEGNGTYDPSLNVAGGIRLKGGNPTTVNFKKIVLAGGQLSSILNSGWPATVAGGEVNVISNSVMWAADDTSPRSLTIQSVLTGNGGVVWHGYNNFTTFQAASSASLNIAGANNTFTGTWDVQLGTLVGSAPNALGTNTITVEAQGALQTTYDINNTNGTLNLSGRMNLTQNDTFKSFFVNGSQLSAGTYTSAQLSSAYPANFPASWTAVTGAPTTTPSGSITVLQGRSGLGSISVCGTMQICWTNSNVWLLSATNILGPWVTNSGASSPYTITNDAPRKFFRLQAQ